MVSNDTPQCGCIESSGLERLRYFPRQLLTADDLCAEQAYIREKQRRHNRFLHGWGVVCGLLVQVNAKAGPLVVTICPGYALGPWGDEIYVPEAVDFDLTATTQRMAEPACANNAFAGAAQTREVTIAIRYAECRTRPVRTLPAGCGCDDSACEFSRIRDSFEIACLPGFPPQSTSSPTLCDVSQDVAKNMPSFPSPPPSDWVPLASILMPVSQTGSTPALTEQSIDNTVRRVVFTTTQIQEQVKDSCCDAS